MMLRFSKPMVLAGALLLEASSAAHAEEWLRGAVGVAYLSGSVVLEEFGGQAIHVDVAELPYFFPGLFSVHAADAGEIFLKASNRAALYFDGPGDLAIERFEQQSSQPNHETLVEPGGMEVRSRMILNLRQGMLIFDGRDCGEASRVILETPVGRISAKNSWWLMKIEYEEGRHVYSFSIECAEGGLRFSERTGANYSLRAGQRLSGVGAFESPSIQVAEATEAGDDFFEYFSQLVLAANELEFTEEAFFSKMKAIVAARGWMDAEALRQSEANGVKRPLVIEYAPRASAVTPFRGIVRPLPESESEIF